MPDIDTAAAIALALPSTSEGTTWGNRAWFVERKKFAWARPFNKADIKRFGDDPVPAGPILAVMVDDLGECDAVIAGDPDVFFTIEHLANYPAVLVRLDVVSRSRLTEALEDAWLSAAPPALAEDYRSGRSAG